MAEWNFGAILYAMTACLWGAYASRVQQNRAPESTIIRLALVFVVNAILCPLMINIAFVREPDSDTTNPAAKAG